MDTLVWFIVNWLPLLVILGVLLFTGIRLSRQYGENLALSRTAIEALRENTAAVRELTRQMSGR